MKRFESLDEPKFSQLDIEKMKRLKGGYTLDTVTVYPTTTSRDGSGCDDGVCTD